MYSKKNIKYKKMSWLKNNINFSNNIKITLVEVCLSALFLL